MEENLAYAGALIGAVACALLFVGKSRRTLAIGLPLWAAAELALATTLASSDQVDRVTGSRLALAAAPVALLALGAVVVLLVRRWELAPLALLLVAPLRIPITLGDERSMLLVPFYGMLVAAALAFAWRLWRGSDDAPPLPKPLAITSAALVGLFAVSLLWAQDLHEGTVKLFFYLFPFALMVAMIGRSRLAAWVPKALAIGLVAEAIVFAAIGLWQQQSGRVFFSRSLELANAYTDYTRSNSLFFDPSIYGRFLVVALSVLLTVLLLRRLRLLVAGPLIAFLWAGLYFSYSQSSLAALFAVGAALVFLTADRRARPALIGAALVLALVGAGLVAAQARGESLKRLSGGRADLASGAGGVFLDHPLVGVGVGSQPLATEEREQTGRVARRSASHTTPVTVAAELGVAGIAAYVAWLGAAALVLLAAWRRDPLAGTALAAVFFGIFIHSLFYSGFFEDAMTWGALALAAIYAAGRFTPGEPEARVS